MTTNILNADVDAHTLVLGMFGDLLLSSAEVPFKKEWADGTGYFSGICRISESFDNTVRFVDPSGRNGVIIWDSLSQSNIAIFERYSDSSGCVVYNVHPKFRQTYSSHDEPFGGSGIVYDKPALVDFLKRTLQLGSVQVRLRAAKAALVS